jgi:hypothetical protein
MEEGTRDADALTQRNVDESVTLSLRDLLRKKQVFRTGTGFFLVLARLVGGYNWFWGWTGKTPWTGWGWLPSYLQKEAMYTPFPQYRAFIQNSMLPNIDQFGWVQFIIEITLSVTITAGFFTGLFGLIAIIWAATIVFGAFPVPGENLYNLLNFLILPIVVWGTRAGRFLGIDAYIRPRLLASKSGMLRWLGKIAT